LHKSNNLDLILVDHNRLAVPQAIYENSVAEIVDHHTDEGKSSHAKRKIEMVGSCATLIAEKILAESPSILSQVDAKVLLAPILLDTVNMDPQYKKATHKDIEVASKLSGIIGLDVQQQKQFFEKLQYMRFSVETLNTYDLLRMDYKQWTMGSYEVGVSSSKRGIQEWKKKDTNLSKEFDKYLKGKKLDILFAMTQFLDAQNNMVRELIIFTYNKEVYENTKRFLVPSELALVEIDVQQSDFIMGFFEQKNVAASRKQLQPLLVELYK